MFYAEEQPHYNRETLSAAFEKCCSKSGAGAISTNSMIGELSEKSWFAVLWNCYKSPSNEPVYQNTQFLCFYSLAQGQEDNKLKLIGMVPLYLEDEIFWHHPHMESQ